MHSVYPLSLSYSIYELLYHLSLEFSGSLMLPVELTFEIFSDGAAYQPMF